MFEYLHVCMVWVGRVLICFQSMCGLVGAVPGLFCNGMIAMTSIKNMSGMSAKLELA